MFINFVKSTLTRLSIIKAIQNVKNGNNISNIQNCYAMKKQISILILFFYTSLVFAQTTLPTIGTKWKYNYGALGLSSGFIAVEAVENVTIANLDCRKLSFNQRVVQCNFGVGCVTNTYYDQYLFQRNDSLFDVDLNGNMRLIIDYKCRLNDVLWLKGYFSNRDSVLGRVRRITDTVIDGRRLKLWEIHYCQSTSTRISKFTFVESIMFLQTGVRAFKHNAYCNAVVEYGDILCFFDNNNGWQYQRIGCTPTNSQDLVSKRLRIYPNPAYNQLLIETDWLNVNYKILDITGKVYQVGILSDNYFIDIETLPNGLFFIHFSDFQANKTIKKFVKN